MKEQLALLPEYLTAHLQLTLLALGIGLVVSVPLGVWVHRRPKLGRWALGAAGVLQTIPSLALLAVMVPVLAVAGRWTLAAFGVQISSIGFLPAAVALTLYSILPILRNTVTGLAGLDRSYLEAARAVGMTPSQRLRQVELPLAAPVIVAGLRTATVWVVGTATLSTPVGATSLGNYIFSGLQTRNFNAVLVGCVAAAALALVLDGLIRMLELAISRRRRRLAAVAIGLLLGLYLFAGGSFAKRSLFDGGEPAVRIGSKTFTEQYILAELLEQQIARRTSVSTRSVPSLGSTVAFDALVAGDIDLYVEYTGTIWATLMGRASAGESRAEVLEAVEAFIEAEHGLSSLGALGFQNTYALAVRSSTAERLGLATITDLARVAPELEIGGDYEFFQRAEWRDLETEYGLRFRERRSMDSTLMYEALVNNEVDAISAFSTDGRIAAYNLRLLEDDRRVVPPYDAVILASRGLERRFPAVVDAVRELAGTLDEKTMQELNLAVDRDQVAPRAAAARFLETRP